MGSSTFGPDPPRSFRQDVCALTSSIGSYVAGKGKRVSSSAHSPKQRGIRRHLIQILPLLNSGRNADRSFLCCARNENELSDTDISTFLSFFTAWLLIKRRKYFTSPLSYLQFQAEWQELDDISLYCLILVRVLVPIFSLVQYSNSGLGPLIVEFSRPHKHTHTLTNTHTHMICGAPLRWDRIVAKASTYVTQNKHQRRASMASAGCKTTIPAITRLQT